MCSPLVSTTLSGSTIPLEQSNILAENAALKQEIERLRKIIKTGGEQNIQLQDDNAALIECVKEVARQSNNHDTTTLKMLARECLAKLGGSPDA
jgi:hypothetical protein